MSLLCSPETALAAAAAVLEGLSIDLSIYAADLGKTFASGLKSKDDSVREDALAAMLALGGQCSDPAAVEQLLGAVFGVLGGSEGKVGLAPAKASLLQAAGGLAASAVSGAGAAVLAASATGHFVTFLEAETHEGSLVLALEQLAAWAARYTNCLPPQLVAWLPKGLALRSTTSPVRSAYLLLLASALHTNTLASALDLIPALTRAVDSAVKQPGQVAMVSEGAHAASCLLRLAATDLATETGLADFFALVTDTERQLFYSEKFLGAAGPAALQSVASLVTELLVSHGDKVAPAGEETLLRALATCCLSGHSAVRRHVLKQAGRVGSSLGGGAIVCALVGQVSTLLSSREIGLETAPRTEAPPGREEGASGAIPAGAAVAALAGLVAGGTFGPGPGGEAELLALALLPAASHPVLRRADRKLWVRLCRRLGVEPAALLARHQAAVLATLEGLLVDRPAVGAEVVRTVVSLAPGVLLPHLLERTGQLASPALLAVTVRDLRIALTPPGELYDRSVVDSLKADTKTQNVARENKAYSYKEQMEEEEMRRDIEKKKAKEGKAKAPELSAKQKEAMAVQLEKEAEVL
jgi:hypothetical protein